MAAADSSSPDTVFNNGDKATVMHPLEQKWTLWFDDPTKLKKGATDQDWKDNVKPLYTFSTVEEFWRIFNNLISIEDKPGCSFHMFKDGIEPMWEHDANRDGGKWVYVNSASTDRTHDVWLNTMLLLIGEQLDRTSDICGAVASKRKNGDKISVWTRDCKDEAGVMAIGRSWKEMAGLKSKMNYQANQAALTTKSSYRSNALFTL